MAAAGSSQEGGGEAVAAPSDEWPAGTVGGTSSDAGVVGRCSGAGSGTAAFASGEARFVVGGTATTGLDAGLNWSPSPSCMLVVEGTATTGLGRGSPPSVNHSA